MTGWPLTAASRSHTIPKTSGVTHAKHELPASWEPNPSTDGDNIVHFRGADVIVAGDVFTTTQYPMRSPERRFGPGRDSGVEHPLKRTAYRHEGEGGTIVVPGHGYVCDEHEVVEYRDMLVIVREGATLAQVKATRLTADYDTRYGATTGPWTTDMFVEAVYRDLSRK